MEQKQIEALFKDPGLMDRRNIRIEIKEQVTSTNDLLKEAAAEGEPEGLVLVALRFIRPERAASIFPCC